MTASLARASLAAPSTEQAPEPGAARWHVGDLRTGRIYATLPLTTTTWSASIDDAGQLGGQLPLASGLFPDIALIAAPARSFLACSYTDPDGLETFLAGGPVWTHAYDDATRTLTLGAAGLQSYYDHRFVMPVLAAGDDPALASVTYSGLTLGTIAKRLVQLAHTHTGGALPVVLPADAAAASDEKHTRTYRGFELGRVGERIAQLSGVDGGPEVQFRPRRRSDDPRYLEWVMLTGSEADPLIHQAGAAWRFDGTVPRSPVVSFSVNIDAGGMGFRAWAAGQGIAEGRPLAYDEDLTLVTDAGYPLLEVEDTTSGSVEDPVNLQAHAVEQRHRSARPIESWTVTVNRDASPRLGTYQPGDWCTVVVPDTHPYVRPTGPRSGRILTMAGGDGPTVTLTLAPTIGAV